MPNCLLKLAASALFSVLTLAANSALAAEGYICRSVDKDLLIQVVLSPQPELDGSKRAVLMVILDPNVSQGRQMIARFNARDGLLNSAGTVFIGHVDPDHPDTNRKGERIAGTTLGRLKQIILDIESDSAVRQRRSVREPFSAQVIYLRRDGRELVQDFDCLYRNNLR